MRPIRVAAQIHPQHGDYPAMRRAVLEAEDMGYDIAYTWDHFFPLYGEPDGAHLECWSLLAAWAEATSRIELGSLVSCVPYRNPNLLADIVRTIDRIAEGRMILGLGGGWNRRDFDEYGYPFGTMGSRLEVLADALPAIARRLDRLNPPPVRRPPVLIGGWGERITLRLVAQYADGWHASFPSRPDELEPKVAALRRWCGEIGRDPGDIEWGLGVEPDDLDRFLGTDADTCVAMGFTQFTLGFNGPDWSVVDGARWLRWRDQRNAAMGSGLQPS